MKNPLALLKKAAVAIVQSPIKLGLTLLVILDQLTQVKAAKTSPECEQVTFTPTGSGRSYTMETAKSDCEVLRALAATLSSKICVKGLNSYESISISSLSDEARTHPTSGAKIKDIAGFTVSNNYYGKVLTTSAAIVADGRSPAVKVFHQTRNPACPTMTFFSGGALNIKDIAPAELRQSIRDLDRYSMLDEGADHCGETTYLQGRRCHTEL